MKRAQRPTTERENARPRVDRIVAERFSATSMSDAKWITLLDGLTTSVPPIEKCRVKLVWDEEIRSLYLSGCTFMFDYWPRAVEGMITGLPRGWYDYKEIEWLEFTGTAEELSALIARIRAIGHFDLETNGSGLRLRAYR